MEQGAGEIKPTNPKDLIGSDKIPMHLWPTTATALGSLGLLDGMLKYGRSNYRAVGVRASIYYDAAMRHFMAWFEGEDTDPDSGLPHMAHLLACVAIIVEAQVEGNLTDDRMYPTRYRDHVNGLTPHVKRLKELRAGVTPKHYTIADAGNHGEDHGKSRENSRPTDHAHSGAAACGTREHPYCSRAEQRRAEHQDH